MSVESGKSLRRRSNRETTWGQTLVDIYDNCQEHFNEFLSVLNGFRKDTFGLWG